MPPFTREGVLKEAHHQIEADRAAEYDIEWLVSDQKVVEQLLRLFQSKCLPINVKSYPK